MPPFAVSRQPDPWRPPPRIPLTLLAALCLVLACRTADPTVTPTVTPPPPTVVDVPPPALPPVVEEKPVVVGPLEVRVGLGTDLESFELPCCDPRIKVQAHGSTDGEALALDAPIRITPGGHLVRSVVYRLQVAALKNEEQAQGIADYLQEHTGEPADSVFDAGTDLYRVRVGRYPDRAAAEAGRSHLESLGLAQGWIASEGGEIEAPALIVQRGDKTHTVAGRWLDLTAPDDVGIPFEGARYRGTLSVYLNDRGRLNVINELPLEEYLRGVVPKEMGPYLYNRLEALKAQTVAARTYTLRNLGEFSQEGYDICSTPRCQVYGGMAVEHRDSDRAIRETAGEVILVDGQPAETFYSSTCGGHTENVEVVFPLKRGDYLRGVPCVEAGASTLRGALSPGRPFPAGLTQRLLPPAKGRPTQVLAARLEHLAFLARQPLPRDRLTSLDRREVARFVQSAFDLTLDRRLLNPSEDLAALVAEPPAAWRPEDLRFAQYLHTSGVFHRPGTVDAQEAEVLLFELALQLGALRHEVVRFLDSRGGRLRLRIDGSIETLPHLESVPTFRRQGESLRSAPLSPMAGDRLDLYWHDRNLVAMVQPVDAGPIDLSRHAKRARWTRYKSLSDLRTSVQARYPGFPFVDFEVLARGVSGRVGKMRLLGEGDKSVDVEGLAVRWTFDVYDTLFYAERHREGNRAPGWTFRGHGWGHGVGMCQAGAYGMALRGNGYRAILEHYYSGVELGRLKPAPKRPRLGA